MLISLLLIYSNQLKNLLTEKMPSEMLPLLIIVNFNLFDS